MILKLQSDSLSGGVYAMQDGRVNLLQGSINKESKPKKEELLDANEEGISEIEKLRRENAKLMRMLEEKDKAKEGTCTTCAIF